MVCYETEYRQSLHRLKFEGRLQRQVLVVPCEVMQRHSLRYAHREGHNWVLVHPPIACTGMVRRNAAVSESQHVLCK